MAIRMPRIVHAKQILGHILPIPSASDVPRGHFAVYVGRNKKRFVIPLSCLKGPSFQNLFSQVEEEFGSSNGGSHYTMQRRNLHGLDFSFE